MSDEIWKPIEGFPKYRVSNYGRLKNTKGQILHPYTNHKGYLKIGLIGNDGKDHKKRVHRLVAEAFIPNTNNYPEVNHKNLNKRDNEVTNLEWVTGEENRKHYQRMKYR